MKITLRSHNIMCRNGSLHMVGQLQDMLQFTRASDLARWLLVSKQTAKTYLDKWVDEGFLTRETLHWRGDALVHEYRLSDTGRIAYEHNAFQLSYKMLLETRGLV